MIEQPIQIEKPLINDTLVYMPLVLDYHRTVIFVQSQRVDPSSVRFPRHILLGQEPYPQKYLHLPLD